MKRARLQVRILGSVQGVGFRPFVYRLAADLDLDGWVRNDGDGVTVEVEGAHDAVLAFLERVQRDAPRAAILYAVDARFVRVEDAGSGFEIRNSASHGPPKVWVLPDLAVCPACLDDVRNPDDRRHRYPFTNCTHCGPRFTILDALPYDRPNTSMAGFALCPECTREYRDPDDRRFHAQPTACPRCGPRLRASSTDDRATQEGDAALSAAATAIRDGKIVGLKGLGGYHLIVDARNEPAVAELRRRKRRSGKPFAVMYPDLDALRRHVDVPSFAEPSLTGTQAPIVLLPRTANGSAEIAPSVAPDSPYLGVFLPYTPLHALLLDDLARPLVATSGNLTDEPIVTDDDVAARELGAIADLVVSHDRPIRRPADDSVLQILTRPRPRPQILRRARGYAPLPLLAPRPLPAVLAVGGQMNGAFAFARGREIVLSQHLGDLDGYEARRTYRRCLDDLLRLYGVEPRIVAHDLHPDYFTTAVAAERSGTKIGVQHHHAHLAACLLEHGVEDGETLGLTWDGTGDGGDGTVWGGEILRGTAAASRRVATLRPFRLPGGETAVKQPWRVALALLDDAFDGDPPEDLAPFTAADPSAVRIVRDLARRGVRAPTTTSMGRLFDGVAAILGIALVGTYQAEPAQRLEYAAWRHGVEADPLPLPIVADGEGPARLDWGAMIRELVHRRNAGTGVDELAAAFHLALVPAALEIARTENLERVALTGGVFCNRFLTEAMLEALERAGHEPLVHAQLPPTDGGLAAGQLWTAVNRMEQERG